MKTTPTLGLKLYDGTDAPDLVAGYNASMEAIDKASAEWGTSDIPENIVTQTNGQLFSPSGTPMTTVGVSNGPRGAKEVASSVALSIVDVPTVGMVSPTGNTKLIHGSESFTLNTESPDITLTTSGGSITWAQLKAALAAIETMKTQIGELQTQIAAKANAADVYTKTAADGKFALKTDIPDVSSFITKTAADAAYQAKGSYATTSTVTALTTRVSTAEGEIDALQTGLAAATAAGTTQLTVADLTAAKTNTKNLVTA